MKISHQIKAIFTGLLFSCSVIPVVMADDIEIYTTSGAQTSGVKPNLLFIIDGSSDMSTTSLVTESYDPDTTYEGSCNSDYIYYAENGGSIPDCDGSGNNAPDYFNSGALVCEAAEFTTQLVLDEDNVPVVYESGEPMGETEVVKGPLWEQGIFSGRLAHYGTAGNGDKASPAWVAIDITRDEERSYTVECEADSGTHGESDGGNTYIDNSSKYVSKADDTNGDAHSIWTDGDSLLTLYSGNYINYTNTEALTTTFEAFFDQIRDAIEYVVDSNSAVNISMMILDQSSDGTNDPGSEGGGILYEMQDGSSSRGNFIPQMWSLTAEGLTPLSEAYYEALLYFGGKAVDYGSDANPPLVGSATDANNDYYTTPIEMSCQKNYIIVASNGKASEDDLSAARQASLNGFTTGECSDTFTPDDPSDDNIHGSTDDGEPTSAGLTNDNCLDELAYWAANNDVAEKEIDEHEGEQTIVTHTVGFGYSDIADFQQKAGKQLLIDTAEKGGGTFYSASSKQDIKDAFDNIIFNALKVNSTFSSPAVSVNAFNRSTHLNDLYFTLFKPADGNHWEGNLKKYKLEFFIDSDDSDGDGDVTESLPFIADKDSNDAINDETGFFDDDAWSYWSATADGKEVGEGGAAGGFTTSRNVYTFTGSYDGVAPASASELTSGVNAVDPDNDELTDEMLDILTETSESVEIVSGTSYRNTLINWASGRDALSDYGVVDTYNDMRLQMGDPLHAEPALVQYGEATYQGETVADLVAYVATNDGYLHAINVNGDSGNSVNAGSEYFSFIPQELLPNLKIAMEDTGGDKLYGLDGSVVAWINDADGNGTISGDNEHVYIYVSMRRGGNNIYALDVTTRTAPKLLWVIKGGDEEGDYTELGQTWSTVNVEKIKDAGVEKTVLIFGGGYDTDQDSVELTTADSVGHTVYIADAATGARLWTAGQDEDVTMDYSVPARVKPLDISGDGFIDRLYVADMGGQIFRFDIDNSSESALASSIIGGVIADLGDASATVGGDVAADERVAANTRRFYYPPDVALINAEDGPYHGLVISSGYRAHPLDDDIQDRIYMIKDRHTGAITSAETYVALTEGDLHNATINMAGGEGGNDDARATEMANITAAEGWFIHLDDEDNTGSWLGEKGLAEALIIEGVAIVTTYTPDLTYSTTSCEPNLGLGKVYFLDMLDATAAFPSSLDARGDRHIELVRGGIPPSPNVIITEDGVPTLCVGTECSKAELGLGVRKTYWYELN
ncbi:MAG: hypothetical protein GQ573_03670 [Gammaproteobacteria bacterium]|nr:hypothetical protein [Gammaproteobacteria bacterium]